MVGLKVFMTIDHAALITVKSTIRIELGIYKEKNKLTIVVVRHYATK